MPIVPHTDNATKMDTRFKANWNALPKFRKVCGTLSRKKIHYNSNKC